MNDPRRLIEGGATDAELRLLRAGSLEEPPGTGMHLLSVLLGPPSTPPPAGAPGAAPGAVKILQGAAAKLGAQWLALTIGAVALTGAVAVVHGARARSAVPFETVPGATKRPEGTKNAAPVRPVVAASEASAPPRPPLIDAPRALVPETTAGPLEASPHARTLVHAQGPVRAIESSPEGTKSIALEIRSLDRVRALLNGHEYRAANAVLDSYSRDNPKGALGQEAMLLRIEALVAVGDKARAGALAERFLRDHPNALHEKRIRTLVGGP